MSDNGEAARLVAEAVAQLSEMLGPIREAAIGYRDRLISEDRFTQAAANLMAADFHHALCATIGMTS